MTNEYIIVNSKTNTENVWQTIASEYTPSKGEVCIIVPSKGNFDDANKTENKSTEVAIKIGNGEDVFRDLPYLTDVSNIRPDWEETNTESPNYIWHKPIVNTDMIVSGDIQNFKIDNNTLKTAINNTAVRFPDAVGEEYCQIANLNETNFTNPLSLLILEDNNWGYYDYTFKTDNEIKEKEVKYFYKNNISKKNKYVSTDKTFGEQYTTVYPVIYNVLETEMFKQNISNLILLRHDSNPGYEEIQIVKEEGTDTVSQVLVSKNWESISSGWSFLVPITSDKQALFYYDDNNKIYYKSNSGLKLYSYSLNVIEDFEEDKQEIGSICYSFFKNFVKSLISGATDGLTEKIINSNGIIELKIIYDVLTKTFFETALNVTNPEVEGPTYHDYELLRNIAKSIQENILDWKTLSLIQDDSNKVYQNYYEINDEVIIDQRNSKLYLKKSKLESLLNSPLGTDEESREIKANTANQTFDIPTGYNINNYYVTKISSNLEEEGLTLPVLNDGEEVNISSKQEISFNNNTVIRYQRQSLNNIPLTNNEIGEEDGYYSSNLFPKEYEKEEIIPFVSGKIIPEDSEFFITYKKPENISLLRRVGEEISLIEKIPIQDFPQIYWEYSNIELKLSSGIISYLKYGTHFVLTEDTKKENFMIILFKDVNVNISDYENISLICQNDLKLKIQSENYNMSNNNIVNIKKSLLVNYFKLSYEASNKTYYVHNLPNVIDKTLEFEENINEKITLVNINNALRNSVENSFEIKNGSYYKITNSTSNKVYLIKVLSSQLILLNTNDNYYYQILSCVKSDDNSQYIYKILFNFNCYADDSIFVIDKIPSSNIDIQLEVIHTTEEQQTVRVNNILNNNYTLVFTRPKRKTSNLEMNFYYRVQSLRSDLVSKFKSNWNENDYTEDSFIQNRPFYFNSDGQFVMEPGFEKQLESKIKSIHNQGEDRSTLIEQSLNNIKQENAAIQGKITYYEQITKTPTENWQNGIVESTKIKGIVEVVKQLINEVKFLENLINTKTEVKISNTAPTSGRLWINTDTNSGNGILYYKEEGNTSWIPVSAPWTGAKANIDIS